MRINELLNKKSLIVKNPNVFQLSFSPSEILERKESEEVMKQLASFIRYRVPTNTLIVGGVGTGKTVTLSYYQIQIKELNLEKPVDIYYINCRDYDTSFKIYSALVKEDRAGIPKNLSLHKFLSKQKNDCIIILDEINLLRDQDILYSFSRPHEIDNDFKASIDIILISNNIYWEENLEPPIRSSLQLRTIFYSNYTPEQLRKILEMRIKLGLNENVIDEAVMNYITAKTVKEKFGDARIALNVLDFASRHADEKGKSQIEISDIDEIFDEAIKATERDYLNKVDIKDLMILYSCFLSKSKRSKDIYMIYEKICNDQEMPSLKYMAFHLHLDYLQAHNLVTLYKLRRGKSFIKEVELKVTEELVIKEYERRFVD